MEILSIKRSLRGTGLKVYGRILGDKGKMYVFAYFRRSTFRGWICSCDNFVFSKFSKGRNCKHLKFVRQQVGRYGASV
jgi:predicted nucleic acid-binding Zn finger protein